MRRCARVTRFVRWVETESRELPTYESFIYTLDMTPKTCYTSEELQKGPQQAANTVVIADKHPTTEDGFHRQEGSISA